MIASSNKDFSFAICMFLIYYINIPDVK